MKRLTAGLTAALGLSALQLASAAVTEFAQADTTPIVYSAECRAKGARAKDCCLWLDVYYADGSATWGTGKARKACRRGTHGWERVVGVFRPQKPVAKVDFQTLFRGGEKRGTLEFRNLTVERREPKSGEETPDTFFDDYPFSGEARPVPGLRDGESEIWTADAMTKVTPLTFPQGGVSKTIDLELAANERESAQICVTAGRLDGWTDGSLEIDTLRRSDGRALSGEVVWQRIGYIPRQPGDTLHSLSPDDTERWVPDPLLPAAPFKVRAGSTQGLWLTVRAAPDATPGVYAGSVKVLRGGRLQTTIRLSVTVRGFALPHTFARNVSLSVMDTFTRALYPDDFKAKKRESWDLMLDHRLSPDDISRFTLPDLDDLEYAVSRGMNRFNILNIVPEPKDPKTLIVYTTTKDVLFSDWFYPQFRDRLVPYVAELRKRGLADKAYLYGFDEQEKEYFPAIEKFWKRLGKDVPGIPLMSTSKAYRDFAANPTNPPPSYDAGDWFCPLTGDWNPATTEALRAKGKKVWWYTCLTPLEPYANFAGIEFPFADGRILGWQTHQARADGFLYWVVNFWNACRNKLDESDTYFPNWSSNVGNHVHGDGVLLYPGQTHVLPSIRLANVRDGVEDAEWLLMAEEKSGRASVDALVRLVTADLTHFNRDPKLIRAVRRAVGDLVEGQRSGVSVDIGLSDPLALRAADELRRHLPDVRLDVKLVADPSLDVQSYRLTSDGKTLTIAGRDGLGVAYGALTFLEKHVGVRWYAEDTTRLPDLSAWRLPILDETGAPTFKSRWYYSETGKPVDATWRFRNKETVCCGLADVEQSGSPRDNHTVESYANAIRAQGLAKGKEFCLSDPAVRSAVAEAMKDFIRADRVRCAGQPDFSVPRLYELSQNDGGNGYACTCANCRAGIAAAGSWSGPNLSFVSAVATEVAKEFPDVRVRTFGYSYTERAPTNGFRAADNVIVRYCRSFLFQPLTAATDNGRFLRDWDRAVREKYAWGYWRTYSGPLFPAVKPRRDISDELRFCRDMHVSGYFAEAEAPDRRSFGALQHWLFLKLSEDPSQDVWSLSREFIEAYYGAAADSVCAFLDYLERRQKETYAKLDPSFVASVTSGYLAMFVQRGYLDREFFETADRLLSAAEASVRDDPRAREHVLNERRVVDRALFDEVRALERSGMRPDLLSAARRLKDPIYAARAKAGVGRLPSELAGREVVEWNAWAIGTSGESEGGFRQLVADPDSAVGCASFDATAAHTVPFRAGLIDDWTGAESSFELAAEAIPQDERYHLLKLGTIRLVCESWVWLGEKRFYSWVPRFGAEAETCDVWVSVKFTGPAYVRGSNRPNRVSYDRLFFVRFCHLRCRQNAISPNNDAGLVNVVPIIFM